MRGRVLALQAMLFLGSTPIGGADRRLGREHFGARYGVAIGAVAALGAGAFGLFMVHRPGHDEELPEEASAPTPWPSS